ncbi:MAG: hypothetical protein KDD43_16540, partial [Bdellovibrionales bacterium]|nr:hypothetical protein [Bdellovibrionales bacterium]
TFVNGTGAELEVFGTYSNTGTVIQNDGVIRIEDGGAGTSQNFTSSSSTVSYLEIEKTGGGTVNMVTTSLTVQNLTFNSGNTSTFLISSGKTLVLPNGTSISNGTLEVAGGGTLQIGNGQTLLVNGGTFKTSGLSDSYPQNLAQKGKITTSGAGTWNFTATSGTVNLVGFQFDYVGTNGLNLGGSTTLANFESGHFTNLSESYSSLKVMQFNISNLPSTFDDIEWHWGPSNTPPAPADSYLLASSTGCGGNTLSFNNWWGDFFDDSLDTPDPDPNTKVSETNCDIVISWANSPVSLVKLDATGFEGEVLLEWATGLETGHLGFNVYRSQNPYSDFIQINDELVRNNFLSLGPQGSYHFIDNNVTNGD